MSAKQAEHTSGLTDLPIGWAGTVNEIAPATVLLAAVESSHPAGMPLKPNEMGMFKKLPEAGELDMGHGASNPGKLRRAPDATVSWHKRPA